MILLIGCFCQFAWSADVRRDRLPLDVEMLADLSNHLVLAAERLEGKTTKAKRGVDQLIALAMELDPGNGRARSLEIEMKERRHVPRMDPVGLQKSREWIQRIMTGLDYVDLRAEGAALRNYLADVLRIVQGTSEMPDSKEMAVWTGLVPELAAYEAKKLPAEETSRPQVNLEPAPEPLVSPVSRYRLQEASLKTLAWNVIAEGSKETHQTLAPYKMRMSIWSKSEADAMPLDFRAEPEITKAEAPARVVTQLLKSHFETLNTNEIMMISAPESQGIESNPYKSYVSAAALVLANAAISGAAPDAMVVGMVKENGDYKLPTYAWEHLRAIGPGNGGRLLIPAAVEGFLPSVLAMDNAEFFLDHEVILASSADELIEFSKKKPNDSFAKASVLFQQIREKQGTQALSPYLANVHIRRRLGEVLALAPYHASAKMLSIHAAGNRPRKVFRPVVAQELRKIIAPLHAGIKESLFAKVAAIQQELDQFGGFVDGNDADLVIKTKSLISQLRILERTYRQRPEIYESYEFSISTIQSYLDSYQVFRELLNKESGE